LGLLAVIGLLAFAAHAQTISLNCDMDIALTCQVQPGGEVDKSTLKINTKSLLELIAGDQGFKLPSNAKLWYSSLGVFILNQDGGVFTNVDTNIFNITFDAGIQSYKITDTAKLYEETLREPSALTLNYNGATVSFNLACVGNYEFYNKVNYAESGKNAIVTSSFSGACLGSGMDNGQAMIIKGTLTGNYSFRYPAGDTNTNTNTMDAASPGGDSNPLGIFPGSAN